MRKLLRNRLRAGSDRGIVAIWTAILMVVFLGMAAIAVDISRWYVEIARLQKTADAAALGGAVFMPGNLSSADDTARALVLANGYDPAQAATAAGEKPSQLKVSVTSTVENPFGAVLGTPTTTITRSAIADYASPVPMGSPCNVLGSEPASAGATGQGPVASGNCTGVGSYWVNIAGANTNKARGDGYSSGYCTQPDDGVGIDNCSPSQVPNPGGGRAFNNADYDPNGYVFMARTKATGTLTLEGYDIGWVATGDRCEEYPIMQGARPRNTFVTTQAEADQRYARGANPYCTGDSSMSGREGDDSAVRTIVTVRQPSADLWNPLSGDVICTLTLPGWDRTTAVSALTGTGGSGSDQLLKRTFHRWTPLTQSTAGFTSGPGCNGTGTIAVQANKDYSVQIRTEGGGGQNRFGLRARLSGGNENVSIFAQSRVSLFNNVNAGTSNFKALRLDSSAAGRTLVVRLFDIGDATNPVNVRVQRPDSASLDGVPLDPNTAFTGCVGTGPVTGNLTDCGVTATASRNGGRWQQIAIPIPSTYRCDADANQERCWVRIRLTTSAAQADTTTWSASLAGDPVRLVE
jgi:Flp pilus assembly protein TadG